jgi:hypothetical protein
MLPLQSTLSLFLSLLSVCSVEEWRKGKRSCVSQGSKCATSSTLSQLILFILEMSGRKGKHILATLLFMFPNGRISLVRPNK